MKTAFIKHLVDGSDRTDFTNDYSTTNADDAVLSVVTGVSYLEIDELVFSLVFGDDTPDYATFMASGALTNGITVKMYDATPTLTADLTDGLPIKTLHDLYDRSLAPLILMPFPVHSPVRQEGVCIWRFQEPLILRFGHTLRVGFSDDLSNAANLLFEISARGRSVA